MSQQLEIIVMIDIEAAIKANTLEGNTYLFDNMKLQGSEGQGTDNLVTAINGTHYFDGSQADEQVLNWLPYGIGSLPPTLPKTFHADKSRNSDLKGLAELKGLADGIEQTEKAKFTKIEDLIKELKRISKNTGVKTKVKNKRKDVRRDVGGAGLKIMDVTGEFISKSEETIPEVSHLPPIITDITGEAVDKEIIYQAEYKSPDLRTEGWYWSASVDTYKPGIYAYTMHIQLYKLSFMDGEWTWVPVNMTFQSRINVTSYPKKNGFTHGGVGMLPIM